LARHLLEGVLDVNMAVRESEPNSRSVSVYLCSDAVTIMGLPRVMGFALFYLRHR